MRIYVRTNEGIRFWIPLPYWLIKLGTGNLTRKTMMKYIPKEQRIYVECIDFSKLRNAMNVLKEYKGLQIVDVMAKDGTVVNIRL